MKRMNLRHVLTILSGIMTSLMSCSDEVANNQNPPLEDETRFTLTVPGLQTPFTRSMDGAPEKHIEEIDILVFSHAASSMGVLEEHIPVSDTILQADNSGVYEVSFKANLSRGTTPKCIVVIANAHDVILNLNLSPGATKANVLQSLIVNQGSKWPVGSTYDPIPMYGETVVSSVDSDISGISLKRMLARIDVENKATANFTLSEVILYNRNTNGLVAPPVGNATTGEADMNAVLPHLPATPAKDISGLSYPLVSGSTGLFGDIYAFEADSATDASGTDHNDRKNATCLVLKGEYEGSDYYYRVDFTHDGSDSSMAGEYMPLLRNHRYQVDITTVQGVGYQTAAEAVAAYSMPSNMRVRTIVYDEGKLSYISYNGQYMVGTNTKSDGILFKAAGEAQSYYAMTDYPGGISVLAIDTEGQSLSSASGTNPSVTLSWLTASLSGDQLTITATANPSHTTERQATLTLTAGRLRHEVEIRQDRLVKTSNCYITPPDSTIRILVSRANEDGTTRINPSAALTAELVWTDNPNGIAANSNIAAISTTGTGSAGELIVTAGSTTGNAVVAVKVGGVIRWSWHIWVVDPSDRPKESGSAGFMDRNLGAITNTPGLVSTFGLHYQWGRKDPFVGLASVNIPLETLIYDCR